MRKTTYFNSQEKCPNFQATQIQDVIDAVTGLRDSFVSDNSEIIAKIDSENMQFIFYNNNNFIIAIIQLNYYQKDT
jgi:hypothetical protein